MLLHLVLVAPPAGQHEWLDVLQPMVKAGYARISAGELGIDAAETLADQLITQLTGERET